jgi:hypothetical protein
LSIASGFCFAFTLMNWRWDWSCYHYFLTKLFFEFIIQVYVGKIKTAFIYNNHVSIHSDFQLNWLILFKSRSTSNLRLVKQLPRVLNISHIFKKEQAPSLLYFSICVGLGYSKRHELFHIHR